MNKSPGPDPAVIASLVLSAEHGDGDAQLALGRIYADPNTQLYDAALARKYLAMAAAQQQASVPPRDARLDDPPSFSVQNS